MTERDMAIELETVKTVMAIVRKLRDHQSHLLSREDSNLIEIALMGYLNERVCR